ncbi:hypothetical protein [Escherichia phage BF17]|nr:hypothetical protein [Escherichia phage BF17]
MKTIKTHFKDTWTEVSTGNIQDILYSTETIHVYDEETAAEQLKVLHRSVGEHTEYGVKHTRELVSTDHIDTCTVNLSKEEMFDFILNNTLIIHPDGSLYSKTDGTQVHKKYNVTINDTVMSGYDLVDAINEYVSMQRLK